MPLGLPEFDTRGYRLGYVRISEEPHCSLNWAWWAARVSIPAPWDPIRTIRVSVQVIPHQLARTFK
jgi:hypothetical protein